MSNAPLHQQAREVLIAAVLGDVEKLRSLVSEGVPVATMLCDVFGSTALHHASAHEDDTLSVAYLLEIGSSVHAEDDLGETPLFAAARACKLAAVKALLAKGAQTDHRNKVQETVANVLIDCMTDEDSEETTPEEILKHLLAVVGVPLANPKDGRSLLHQLVTLGDGSGDDIEERMRALVEWLVKKKMLTIDRRNMGGVTPLLEFLSSGLVEAGHDDPLDRLKWLIKLGADVNIVASDGSNALHALLEGSNCQCYRTQECLAVLLGACDKARLQEVRHQDGATPLMLACECTGAGALPAVIALVRAGASAGAGVQDKEGATLFHRSATVGVTDWLVFSACGGMPSDMECLLTDMKAEQCGRGLLHHAALRGAYELVPYLVERHALRRELDGGDNEGNTPLHYAVQAETGDRTKCVGELLRLGANPLARNKEGATPLELAAGCGASLLHAAEAKASEAKAGGALVSALQAMRADGRMTDTTLECGGETFRCHALVLAAQGSFWETLVCGPLARPDGCYSIEEVSAETLRTVLDYCYTGALPDSIGMSALALLMRAAHRFLMRPLLERCEVRASSLLRVSDNGLFAVLDAASANGDDETVAMVERYLLRPECAEWVRSLVKDKEAWAGLCQPGSAANGLLQSLVLKMVTENAESKNKKRKRGGRSGRT